MADDAGALLVRSGLVTASALDEARARVDALGGTIGEALVAGGAVDDDALTSFYQQRLLVPRVNPNSLARLPTSVVGIIPADLAVELRAVPVSLDGDNNLTVAMSDPSDRHAVDEISFRTGAYVVRAAATQMQIAWCLAHYYGHVTHLGQRLLQGDTPGAVSRPRTVTEQVKAARHRRLERGELMVADLTTLVPSSSDPAPSGAEAVRPRARTASGEIRVPIKRAASIKPPLPDDSGPIVLPEEDTSGPVITIEADARDSDPVITIEAETPSSEDPTDRRFAAPRRKRPAVPDPPELAARAGEVQLATGAAVKAIDFEEPSILISDELTRALRPSIAGELRVRDDQTVESPPTPSVIYDERSEPVLLERRRAGDDIDADPATDVNHAAAPAAVDDVPSDVIELAVRKPTRRVDRITQVGIGPVPVATRTDLGGGGGDLDDEPTGARRLDDDPTRLDAHAAPPGEDYTSTSDDLLAAPPDPTRDTSSVLAIAPGPASSAPGPSGQVRLDQVRRAPSRHDLDDDEDDIKTQPTAVMTAVELDDLIPGRTSDVLLQQRRGATDVDGWGPTIPPPLLGAIPGALEPTSGVIPLPDIDSAPLIVAPPSPPVHGSRPHSSSETALTRALEDATARVLELIRTLDHASDRDQVLALLIAHLAESHQRVGFFVIKGGELGLFAITPRVATMPIATLRIDRPSTLQDVIGTRLPYRGPVHDEASRVFLQAVLGACPPELLLVPVAIRERVVGVLFGDHRMAHTFDDQLALAARAAGLALERILKSRRG